VKPLSPLLLQAQIVPPAGGGSFGLADTSRLENPYQAPMWLDEIRFRLPTSTGTTSEFAVASSMKVELKLGDIPLTNGFVPIPLFGKVLNDITQGGGAFTWRLPKPLFIPARELLRPTAYFEPYSGAPTKTLTVTYCCRPLPRGTPTPKTLQIPWVTYFKPDYLTVPGAVDTTNQSQPSDLFNPWNEYLHVQRFIGEFFVRNIDTGGAGFMSLASANINLSTGLLTTGTLVSAQDSFNNILVRDQTPFSHLFSIVDRAWTVNSLLPPKGFYLFTLDRLWSAYGGAATATVGIGMVGWREVPYL
jgi:hypothetical protein